MLPSYQALGASSSHSPLGEVLTASLAVSGCKTSVWGLRKGLGLNCRGIFLQWFMQMGLLKFSVQPSAVAAWALVFASDDHIKISTVAFADVGMHVYTSCHASLWGSQAL